MPAGVYTVKEKDPTKTGYTFGGYWGAPSGTGPKYINADGTSNGTWQNEASTYTLYAGCPMDPAKAQLAYDLMMKGVNEATIKIDAADVQKAKEFMLKQFDENARNNNYWLDVLYNYNRWGVDSYTNYKDIVKSLTPEKLSAFLKNVILSSGNKMEVMMTPAQ